MKKLLGLLVLASIFLTSFGQEDERKEMKTLFGNNRYSNGGYGGFSIGYSVIDDKDALVVGGRGAWVIGNSLAIGVAGAGFVNDYHYNVALDYDVNLAGGYGGLFLEPIVFPHSPVHLAFPIIAGIGGISYNRINWYDDPWDYNDSWVEDAETFLIIEPGVELEFNLLKFFRLGLGVSYRYTSKINLYDTPSDVLTGITTGVSFKFGKF
jgi:hypothetical protein